MAFMMPVVRSNWEVLSDSGKYRSSKKGGRQSAECLSKENLSSSALQQGGPNVLKKTGPRNGIQNRYHQNARPTTGSLPSNVHSVHLSSTGQVCASAIPPRVYKSICGSYPVSHQRIGHKSGLQSKPDTVSTVSLPAATQGTPTSIKDKSSQRSSSSLFDRLRRSMRLNSNSSAEEADNAEDDNGTRASS